MQTTGECITNTYIPTVAITTKSPGSISISQICLTGGHDCEISFIIYWYEGRIQEFLKEGAGQGLRKGRSIRIFKLTSKKTGGG